MTISYRFLAFGFGLDAGAALEGAGAAFARSAPLSPLPFSSDASSE